MRRALISLESVGKRFGGVQALKDVALTLEPGEIHCLAGENGSGKSTLIKVLSGAVRPDAGRILIGERTLDHLTPVESMRLGIQVIYQDLSIFPNLSVAENLALNTLLEQRKRFVRWRDVRSIARRALDDLGVELDLDRLVGELPVAQRQLVAIARALLHDARVIVMDEPTAALGGTEVETLFGMLRRLKAEGLALLFVSHKLREMLQIADRFTFLRNGEVVASAPVSELDESKIAYHMTGRHLAPGGLHRSDRADQSSLLSVSRLTGDLLRDVSLELRPGEIVGLTGLLGAGQTELALTLAGLLPLRSGRVLVRGRRATFRDARDATAAGIAYVPEDRLTEGLFLDQSVEQNTAAASVHRLRSRSGLVSLRKLREHAERWISELGVRTPSVAAPVRTLSGGNQQRVVLAKWLSTHPSILILNGPSVGIDVGSKEDIHRKLRGLAAEGMGILIISDDLPELARNCTRVLVLYRGRVCEELGGDSCTEEALTRALSTR